MWSQRVTMFPIGKSARWAVLYFMSLGVSFYTIPLLDTQIPAIRTAGWGHAHTHTYTVSCKCKKLALKRSVWSNRVEKPQEPTPVMLQCLHKLTLFLNHLVFKIRCCSIGLHRVPLTRQFSGSGDLGTACSLAAVQMTSPRTNFISLAKFLASTEWTQQLLLHNGFPNTTIMSNSNNPWWMLCLHCWWYCPLHLFKVLPLLCQVKSAKENRTNTLQKLRHAQQNKTLNFDLKVIARHDEQSKASFPSHL